MNKNLEKHYQAFIEELDKLNIKTAPNIKVIFEAGWEACFFEMKSIDNDKIPKTPKIPKIPKNTP